MFKKYIDNNTQHRCEVYKSNLESPTQVRHNKHMEMEI